VHPLWLANIGEKGRTFEPRIWDKMRCYWEHLWELGGHCKELIGNLSNNIENIWEQKNFKNKSSNTPQKEKR